MCVAILLIRKWLGQDDVCLILLLDAVWKLTTSTHNYSIRASQSVQSPISLTHADQGSTADPPGLGRPPSAHLTGQAAVPYPQGHGQGSEVSQLTHGEQSS